MNMVWLSWKTSNCENEMESTWLFQPIELLFMKDQRQEWETDSRHSVARKHRFTFIA